ncbi:MAG TPA: ferredoxin [Nitrososphaerales archaeon]|nr:ferredoxin [Nitrososphaerales archaeon]
MKADEPGEVDVKVSRLAYARLSKARKQGENYSDVVLRLISSTLDGLQRRGEMLVQTSDGRDLVVMVDQDKCLGAMSCVAVLPEMFAFDTSMQGSWRRSGEPLGMREVPEGELDSEALLRAAQSCPYQAIRIKDNKTGEELST